MNILSYLILYIWIVGIVIIQFDQATRSLITRYDYMGYFPSFHLFSPHPFIGRYRIKYQVMQVKDNKTIAIDDELEYMGHSDLIDTNQKVIKCIDNLCRSSLAKPAMRNINFIILTNFIKNDAKKKCYSGRFQFFIWHTTGVKEELKFKSRIYDL